jgi:hypothetical protein
MPPKTAASVAKPKAVEKPAAPKAPKAELEKKPTVKQSVMAFLTEKGEKYPKAATLNSLVERFYAAYPEFFQSLRLDPVVPVNLQSKEEIPGFDASLDPEPAKESEDETAKTEPKVVEVKPKPDAKAMKPSKAQKFEDTILDMLDRIERLEMILQSVGALCLGSRDEQEESEEDS